MCPGQIQSALCQQHMVCLACLTSGVRNIFIKWHGPGSLFRAATCTAEGTHACVSNKINISACLAVLVNSSSGDGPDSPLTAFPADGSESG